jgi:hypothetical protein
MVVENRELYAGNGAGAATHLIQFNLGKFADFGVRCLMRVHDQSPIALGPGRTIGTNPGDVGGLLVPTL